MVVLDVPIARRCDQRHEHGDGRGRCRHDDCDAGGHPGDRTIGVTSDDVTASMVVSPSCPGTALPRTSTVAPEAPSTSVIALVASAIVVVLAASIFATVRRRAHRD